MQRIPIPFRRAVTAYRPHLKIIRAASSFQTPSPRLPFLTKPHFRHPNISQRRYESSLIVPESEKIKANDPPPAPSYQLTFTCKPCKHRSAHRVSKQGYHHGTVLIQCPNCKSRHVVSDHLKIFMDEASTLEDILKRTAGTDKDLSKLLKKGRLGQREGQLVGNEGEQDLEFWEDGTTSKYTPA